MVDNVTTVALECVLTYITGESRHLVKLLHNKVELWLLGASNSARLRQRSWWEMRRKQWNYTLNGFDRSGLLLISSCYSYTLQLARSGSYSRAGYNNNNIGSQSDRITRDWKGLSLNDETKTETKNVWVSMTRPRPRLKRSESQWRYRDRDWKDLSLRVETETETTKTSRLKQKLSRL